MRKEILEALKAKFPGVNANVLNRIADKLSKTVTTAEQVTTAVAGVTQEFIEIIESYGDSRATEAQQTAVQTYESKYGLKDGQKIDNGGAAGGQAGGGTTVIQQPTGGANDQTNALLQQLIDQNKALTDRLNKMDGQRTTEIRKQQLSTIIEKLPENLRKAYERTPVDNLTDEQFNTLVGEITTEVNGIVSETQAKGAVFGRPATQGGTGNQGDALTKEQLDAIAHRDSKPVDGQPF
jgi:hypothetical protein|nr:MAG TPA: hypothetical protein [Caudoviricetes sp.]